MDIGYGKHGYLLPRCTDVGHDEYDLAATLAAHAAPEPKTTPEIGTDSCRVTLLYARITPEVGTKKIVTQSANKNGEAA